MPQGLQTTKHLLLNQRVGWRAGTLSKVVSDEVSGQLRLQTLPSIDRPLVDAQGDFGGLVLPVSMAADDEGRLYILDGQTLQVKRFDPCKQMFEVLPTLGGEGSEARSFLDPHRIAISARNDLYVADSGNRRVQVFALKGLSLRAIWGPLLVTEDEAGIRVRPIEGMRATDSESNDEDDDDNDSADDVQPDEPIYPQSYPQGTWQPWDIALSSRNWAYVSDYANGLIHVFDAQGKWRTAFKGDSAQDKQPPLEKPTAITLDKQGHIYIIQEGKSYVTVLDTDGTFLQQVQKPAEVQSNFCPLSVAVDEEGNIYLCDGATRRLYYYCRAGDGTFASPATCQNFYCTGTAIIFDKTGKPLLLDAQQQKVLMLKTAVLYEDCGTYISCALDSAIYNCQWHRVLLSATILPGTSITVETFTSENFRTPEEIQSLPSERWQTNVVNNQVGCADWDCLVLSQPGRYLWLRLALTGEGETTPTIQQIRVYFPRSSSLQYLPATYSEDSESRDFLDRFLSIFDTMRGRISQQITDIAHYFDPASAPIAPLGQPQKQDFLPWLASWIGLTVDRHWPDEKKRQLVRQAYQLYRLRGTPEGLRQHIRLYMDTDPYILEHFKLRNWLFLDANRLGDQSTLWGKSIVNRLQLDGGAQLGSFQLIDSGDPLRDPFYRDAHQFTVFIPIRQTSQPNDPTQLQTLQRIIEMAKPAHTQGYLQLVQPRFRIGIQSLLGLDTVIGRYPNATVTGEDRLGYETVLGPSSSDKPPTMSVGKQSRIGSSTIIN
jgi:phage tail-like protein